MRNILLSFFSACFFSGYAQVSDCEPSIALNDPEINHSYLYQASKSIRVGGNYEIAANSGDNITMKAGKVIVLKPKTIVAKGNKYLARIEACENLCPTAAECIIPKGISPNADNVNDSFDLSAFCVRELNIVNRYGETVYKASDYKNEWHGQSEKGDLPTGTYYYSVLLSTNEQLTGWVYIQRED
jgi:gliding motility-associated-like protein